MITVGVVNIQSASTTCRLSQRRCAPRDRCGRPSTWQKALPGPVPNSSTMLRMCSVLSAVWLMRSSREDRCVLELQTRFGRSSALTQESFDGPADRPGSPGAACAGCRAPPCAAAAARQPAHRQRRAIRHASEPPAGQTSTSRAQVCIQSARRTSAGHDVERLPQRRPVSACAVMVADDVADVHRLQWLLPASSTGISGSAAVRRNNAALVPPRHMDQRQGAAHRPPSGRAAAKASSTLASGGRRGERRLTSAPGPRSAPRGARFACRQAPNNATGARVCRRSEALVSRLA